MNAAQRVPDVSVIVPARNEEASLGACLQSLTAQAGVNFEVIVVDDGSTDQTRKIASSFPEVQVIEPGPLPARWSGKNNAMNAGAIVARGSWLLFTDADTVHLPGSLARSLAEANQRGVELLSYSPEQEVHGFWEKAVMPVIFAELAATYQLSDVKDPSSPTAAANGQYILISRNTYDAVGGYAAVATSLLEDVALAQAVKRSGRRIWFRYGGDAVRTRMYRSFRQLREGWTKNLVLLFHAPLRLAVLRMIEFLVITGSCIIGIAAAASAKFSIAILGFVAALLFEVFLLLRIRKAHFSWDATGLSLLGLPIFSYLLLRSWFFYKKGMVTWKGRLYSSTEPDQSVGVLSESLK